MVSIRLVISFGVMGSEVSVMAERCVVNEGVDESIVMVWCVRRSEANAFACDSVESVH
jgi:hypothetical protein